jgi:hypothetical protein
MVLSFLLKTICCKEIDELWGIIWEHTRERKKRKRRWRILLSSFGKGITFMFVILQSGAFQFEPFGLNAHVMVVFMIL